MPHRSKVRYISRKKNSLSRLHTSVGGFLRISSSVEVMSEKVCKILLVLALMLGVPQAWGKFVMLIYLCHFT